MAFPDKTAKWASTTNTTSETVELGFTAVANQLLVVHIGWRSTSATASISGFTAIDSPRANDAWRSQCFVKIAAGGETSLAITFSTSSFSWGLIAYAVTEADVSVSASAALAGFNYNTGGTAATLASPSLDTTGTDNCLLLHFSTWDSVYQIPDHESINCLVLNQPPTASQTYTASAIGYQATGGAIPTWNYSANNAANAGLSWVLAVKNAASGNAPIILSDGRKYVQRLAGFDSISGGAPNSVTGLTQINGIPTGSVASSSSIVGIPQSAFGIWGAPGSIIRSAENLSAGTYPNGAWVGLFSTMSAANIASKSVIIPFGYGGTTDNTRVGQYGGIIVFVDSSNNWAAYTLEPQVKWTNNGSRVITINTANTTKLAGSETESGSSGVAVDFTDIVNVGYLYHRKPGTTTSVDMYVASPTYVNSSCILTRGGSGNQIKVKQIARYLNADGLFPEHAPFQGAGQMISKFGLQLGDGSAASYTELTTQSFETPSTENVLFQAGANTVPLVINASASDTVDWSSAIIATEYANTLTVDAASSTSATYNFQGASIIGYTVTWKTGVPCTGISFKNCAPIAFKGADVSNVTVSDTTASASQAAITFDTSGATVADTTIDVTGTSAGYHIELGTSVTGITLNDVTFTGTPGTDKIHVLATTGTVTITANAGTAITLTDVTTEGATVVIAAPTVNQSVTITGSRVGSRWQIYDTDYNFTVTGVSTYPDPGETYTDARGVTFTVISAGAGNVHTYAVTAPPASGTLTKTSSGTGDATLTFTSCSDDGVQLFNGTATAGNAVVTGGSVVWTDPVAAVEKRYIRLRRAYTTSSTADLFLESIIGVCGTTAATAAVTFLDSSVVNSVYVTNAIDGPAQTDITFTDSTTDTVSINKAGGSTTWPIVYAAWVAHAYTEAGIAKDIDYISAPDPANYALMGLKIKNTSSPSVPLTITGGYGRDALTGSIVDIVDTTGGNVYPLVDHVVAYATGSALTAGQSAELTAIKTATDAYLDASVAAAPAATVAALKADQTFKALCAPVIGEQGGAGTPVATYTFNGVTVTADVPLPGVTGNRTNVVITGS